MGDNHSSLRIEGNGNKHSYFSHLQRAVLPFTMYTYFSVKILGGMVIFGKVFGKFGIEVEKMT